MNLTCSMFSTSKGCTMDCCSLLQNYPLRSFVSDTTAAMQSSRKGLKYSDKRRLSSWLNHRSTHLPTCSDYPRHRSCIQSNEGRRSLWFFCLLIPVSFFDDVFKGYKCGYALKTVLYGQYSFLMGISATDNTIFAAICEYQVCFQFPE